MVETNVSEPELAELTDIQEDMVSGILHGTASITEELAGQLERGTKIKAQFWINLQGLYDRAKTTMPLSTFDDALERLNATLESLKSAVSTADAEGGDVGRQLFALVAEIIQCIATDIDEVSEFDSTLTPSRIVHALQSRARGLARLAVLQENPEAPE